MRDQLVGTSAAVSAALEAYRNHLDQGGGEHPADGVAVRPSGRQLVAGEWLEAGDQYRQRDQDALGELVLFAPPFHHKLLHLSAAGDCGQREHHGVVLRELRSQRDVLYTTHSVV